MSKKDQKTVDVDSVRAILGWTGGGIHKRIDENRELVELLQHDGFLDRYPWAIEWLRCHDEFLSALLAAVPIQKGLFMGATRGGAPFPRPWPQEIDDPMRMARLTDSERQEIARQFWRSPE